LPAEFSNPGEFGGLRKLQNSKFWTNLETGGLLLGALGSDRPPEDVLGTIVVIAAILLPGCSVSRLF
jgi:hypothetical protein